MPERTQQENMHSYDASRTFMQIDPNQWAQCVIMRLHFLDSVKSFK